MTICALLLARQFFDLSRRRALQLRHAGPAVRQRVDRRHADPFRRAAGADGGARVGVDTPFMLGHFGWRAVDRHRRVDACAYYLFFRREFAGARRAQRRAPDIGNRRRGRASRPVAACRSRRGSPLVHLGFMAWTVVNAHYPACSSAASCSSSASPAPPPRIRAQIDLKTPLLVGFFLAGLVIHGGLQGWWIAPVLREPVARRPVLGRHAPDRLQRQRADHLPRHAGAELGDGFKVAVVEGAVTGGGLTVIANAPNPAGQALLGRFFGDAVSPASLFAAALMPTLIAAAAISGCCKRSTTPDATAGDRQRAARPATAMPPHDESRRRARTADTARPAATDHNARIGQ